jgi:hypothetical protein
LSSEPVVTKRGPFDMQVCVPHDWCDRQIIEFAELNNPCGTELGWSIRRQGDALLSGAPEHQACQARPGFIHVMLDA